MANNDVAVFLDLDNLVIGARDANLHFDVNLILDRVKELTNGRVVLRRAYSGNLRQDQKLMKELAAAGFTMQSAVPVNAHGKNLIDMYLVVDTLDTMVDRQEYTTYVLVTGDRDFMPLVQALRRRGKHVIGVGLRHATSESLTALCDQYFFYEDLLPSAPLADRDVEVLLKQALDSLVNGQDTVRASVLKERMIELSQGQFGRFQYSDTSFSKFLGRFPHIVHVDKEGTTAFVRQAQTAAPEAEPELYPRYRSALKRQKFRIVPPRLRLLFIRYLIDILSAEPEIKWRDLIDRLAAVETGEETADASRNMANAMLIVARKAGVIRTLKGRTLSAAPVLLALDSDKSFQEAVIRCDAAYLQAIKQLSEPYDLEQAAIAIYDAPTYVPYLERVEAWLAQNPID
jgi:uncharacterized LabA/DUF88 family protein